MKKIFILVCTLGTLLFAGSQAVYTLDFSKQKDGDANAWMKAKGFEFLLDAKALHLHFKEGRLVFETTGEKAGLFGVRFHKGLQNVDSAVIEWGVEKFPQGADWATGNNRVAIGAIFVLGTEKFSAGVPFVKRVPYFLCPFIGEKETVGQSYKGKLYKESGRYYCVSSSKGLVKTRFDIASKFSKAFGGKAPALSAFALQMNTKDTNGGAKAFIKKITVYSK